MVDLGVVFTEVRDSGSGLVLYLHSTGWMDDAMISDVYTYLLFPLCLLTSFNWPVVTAWCVHGFL